MLCCICKEPRHLGANCDYSWILPTVHGAPTDESEIVNIEDEQQHSPSTDVNIEDDQQDSSSIDENLLLSSVLPPPAQCNQSAEEPIDPSSEQLVSDLTAQPLPEQSKELNQPDPSPEQPAQPSQTFTSISHSDCFSSPSESTPTDSPLITSQGLIASIKSIIKPPSRLVNV